MKRLLFTLLSTAVLVAALFSLSACNKEKTASVVFMSNGKMFASIDTAGNMTIPMPPDPVREGFVFGGWFYDENLWDEPYDNTKWETIPLLGDVTVYAKWKPTTPCEVHTPREFSVLEESSCASAGVKQTVCRVCDATYTEPIAPLAHTPLSEVTENYVAPSCKVAGSYDAVVYCEVCSSEVSRTHLTVEKLAHTPTDTPTLENLVDSTCSTEGSYDEVYACTVCDENASVTHKIVEKKAHTPSTTETTENMIPSTCKTQGSYDKVNRCTVCNEVASSTTHTLPLANHTATIPCKNCGIKDFLTFEYDEAKDCYFVSGATMSNFTEITIPDKYNGKSVKGIAEGAFKDFAALKKITIPSSVMTIEKNAFEGCSALTDVVYGGTKTEWGYVTVPEEGNLALINAKKEYGSNRTEWMPF